MSGVLAHRGLLLVGGAGDASWGDVAALIQPTGSDNSTSFVDESTYAHSITVRGGAKQSTEQQVNGLNSIECDGNGDAIRLAGSAAFEVGSSESFTLEFFVRFNSVTARQIFVGFNGGISAYFDMHRNSNSKLVWAGNGDLYEFNQVLATNTTYHVAVSRDGTDIKGFIDGVTRFSAASSTAGFQGDGANGFEIGCTQTLGGDSLGLNGYITQIRHTVGVARYTADFTPPAAAFPTS